MPESRRRKRRSRDEIEEIVAAFRQSGQPTAEFAATAGVHATTLYKWVRDASAQKEAPQKLQVAVPVRVRRSAPTVSPGLEIELANGRTVRVTGKIDKDVLRDVVEILER